MAVGKGDVGVDLLIGGKSEQSTAQVAYIILVGVLFLTLHLLTGHELEVIGTKVEVPVEHVGHLPFVAALQLVGKVGSYSLGIAVGVCGVELTVAFTEILVVELVAQCKALLECPCKGTAEVDEARLTATVEATVGLKGIVMEVFHKGILIDNFRVVGYGSIVLKAVGGLLLKSCQQ